MHGRVQADRVGKILKGGHIASGNRIESVHQGEEGVYTLIISVRIPLRQKVGRLGSFRFPRGLYLYTGSALGPGGLNRRIGRHFGHRKSRFWHIDYLLASGDVRVELAICATTHEHMECRINKSLEMHFKIQAKGFGSSDCVESCISHLLRSGIRSKAQLCDVVFNAYKRSGLRPTLYSPRSNSRYT